MKVTTSEEGERGRDEACICYRFYTVGHKNCATFVTTTTSANVGKFFAIIFRNEL